MKEEGDTGEFSSQVLVMVSKYFVFCRKQASLKTISSPSLPPSLPPYLSLFLSFFFLSFPGLSLGVHVSACILSHLCSPPAGLK